MDLWFFIGCHASCMKLRSLSMTGFVVMRQGFYVFRGLPSFRKTHFHLLCWARTFIAWSKKGPCGSAWLWKQRSFQPFSRYSIEKHLWCGASSTEHSNQLISFLFFSPRKWADIWLILQFCWKSPSGNLWSCFPATFIARFPLSSSCFSSSNIARLYFRN